MHARASGDHVEVVRISPTDARHLGGEGTAKLEGIGFHHFAAFFDRAYRENDYLWGRLDAAERLIGLLLDDPEAPGIPAPAGECKLVFAAILAEEAASITSIPAVVQTIHDRVARLSSGGARGDVALA